MSHGVWVFQIHFKRKTFALIPFEEMIFFWYPSLRTVTHVLPRSSVTDPTGDGIFGSLSLALPKGVSLALVLGHAKRHGFDP